MRLETRDDYTKLDDEALLVEARRWRNEYNNCLSYYRDRKERIGLVLDDYQKELHNRGLRL